MAVSTSRAAGQLVPVILVMLLIAASPSHAQTTFTYQGKLTDGGAPANGVYSPTFTLWDAATNGNQVGSTNIFEGLVIDDGLFTVNLNFGAGTFNGQDRWLEISVGGETLTPRQPIRPTPYAMVAQNVGPGAVPFEYSGANAVFTGANVGIGTSNPQRLLDLQAGEAMLRLTATDPTPGRTSRLQFKGSAGPSIFHPMGAVEFFDENDSLRSTITSTKAGPTGASMYFNVTPGQVSQLTIGSGLVRANDLLELRRSVDLELAAQIGSDGNDSYFQLQGGNVGIATETPDSQLHIDGSASSIVGLHVEAPGAATGAVLISSPFGHTGISGRANNGNRRDIYFMDAGLGLFTRNASASPFSGNGLFIAEDGDVGIGHTSPIARLDVRRTDSGTVFRGQGSGSGTGLSLSGNSIGVQVSSLSSTGTAFSVPSISGSARAASFYGNSSNDMFRVWNDGTGPAIQALGASDASAASGGLLVLGDINALNIGIDNNEIMARNNGAASVLHLNAEGGEVRIGQNSGGGGLLSTPVLTITGGSDLSEMFDVGGDVDIKPGMVVSIDPESAGRLLPSCEPYDPKVAGIVSGAGDVATGMTMGHDGTIADGEHPIALSGRVYCYVDATQHAIKPGDLLTTSSTPGHAMKAIDRQLAHGAIIGKAMTSLERGELGLVLVLVNLH